MAFSESSTAALDRAATRSAIGAHGSVEALLQFGCKSFARVLQLRLQVRSREGECRFGDLRTPGHALVHSEPHFISCRREQASNPVHASTSPMSQCPCYLWRALGCRGAVPPCYVELLLASACRGTQCRRGCSARSRLFQISFTRITGCRRQPMQIQAASAITPRGDSPQD